eukprot:CAMPEP_0173432762 /NCGR_PEP_ID=MMETSP1357-20121228/10449_1 /TAXON_ID=77926 /ORGANISM="Hemiselmis rufescens, Strain PCC563" /LENGTH=472 /DNA_ID=CAMNT_0014397403 /DNA_START=407 /DNA_END=1821 /DNA_ORIENTATION=+
MQDPRAPAAGGPLGGQPFAYDSSENMLMSLMQDRGMLGGMEMMGGGAPPRALSQEGKIFVGGLNWITTTESLRAHFERFGAIADCVIMKDRNTQQPRGFGFVTFIDAQVANDVASQKQVMVDGRNVEVKRAVPRGDDDPTRQRPNGLGGPPRPLSSLGVKRIPGGSMSTKIFVGGISWSTTDEEFLKHFERYGPVAAAHVMKYRDGTPRGFGYVTFMSEDSVDRACGSRNNIGGREVDVKRAVSKEEMDLVKTHDPATGRVLGGVGIVPPGFAGMNTLLAGARQGGPYDDRALSELLLLQQQAMGGQGGGMGPGGIAELLQHLHMQSGGAAALNALAAQQAGVAPGGGFSGDPSQGLAAQQLLQELIRQHALIGSIRHQQGMPQQGGLPSGMMQPGVPPQGVRGTPQGPQLPMSNMSPAGLYGNTQGAPAGADSAGMMPPRVGVSSPPVQPLTMPGGGAVAGMGGPMMVASR